MKYKATGCAILVDVTDAKASDAQHGTIVTAQRREQSLQEVPLAVSAFGAEKLQARKVTNTLDIVNLIGHRNAAVGTANAYSMRGLANTETISTFDPPVSTYIDDINVSRQGANSFSLFDIERVEVLRGRQGRLFGRNTTGGAINVIMARLRYDF